MLCPWAGFTCADAAIPALRWVWSIRLHAFHSVLMTTLGALIRSALCRVEEILPWFLSTVARELRFAINICFVLVWVALLVTGTQEGGVRRFR